MNKLLKYTNVQNINKTERSNEGCDNIYIFQIIFVYFNYFNVLISISNTQRTRIYLRLFYKEISTF